MLTSTGTTSAGLAILVFTITCLAKSEEGAEDSTPVEIFTGSYFQPLPDVLPYSSVIPIIYKIPFTTKLAIPEAPVQQNLCRNSFERDPANCQIQNNLVRMQILIAEQMKEENNVFEERKARTRRSLSFVGSFFKWCCDLATQSEVADMVDNEKDISEHANLLIDEVGLDHKDLVKTTENINNFSQQVQGLAGKVHDSIRLLQNRVDSLQNTSGEALQHQLLALSQQLMIDVYFNYYHDNLREARRSCEARRLPNSLVSRATLRKDLIELEKSTINNSLYLGISYESHLHLYYTLPITSCKFLSDAILISMKVPLRKSQSKMRAYRNIPVPLQWREKLCYLSLNEVIMVKNSTETQILHEHNRHCNEQTFPLCKLPRTDAKMDISHQCITNILHGADAETLRRTCNFVCQERTMEPVITELLPNKFLITNIHEPIYITCPGTEEKLLPADKTGTLELNIPCNCKVQRMSQTKRNTTLIHTIEPCDANDHGSFSITHLLPVGWSKLQSISILPLETNLRHKFDDDHGIIDEDWNLTTTVYHTHPLIKEDLLKHIKLKHEMSEIINNKDLIIYILIGWMALLTITTLISLYLIHVLYIKRPERPPPFQQQHITPPPRRTSRQQRDDTVRESRT